MAALAFGYPPLTAEILGCLGENLAPALALPPSQTWSHLPQIPCLSLLVMGALTWRPVLQVSTSKPEHSRGAQLELGSEGSRFCQSQAGISLWRLLLRVCAPRAILLCFPVVRCQ